LKKLYLTTAFDKPAGAVDYGSFGFIWDGAVTGPIVAPQLPALPEQYDLFPIMGGAATSTVVFKCDDHSISMDSASIIKDSKIYYQPDSTKPGYPGTGDIADIVYHSNETWTTGVSIGGTKNFSVYNQAAFTFEALENDVKIVISYNNGTQDGVKDSIIVAAGATSATMPLLAEKDSLKSIIFSANLTDAQKEAFASLQTRADKAPTNQIVPIVKFSAAYLEGGAGIVPVKPVASQAYGITGGIVVKAANENVSVYGIDGRLVKQVVTNNRIIDMAKGLYIVKVGTAKAVKVVVK